MLAAIFVALTTQAVVVEKNVEAVMRDGVVLRADIYRPDSDDKLPALLKRTPYSKSDPDEIALYQRLASRGFVVAVQDTRGRYTSDGVAVPHDEARDGADTVLWLAGQSFVNGKVGMFGGSYEATTQLAAASLQPEALKALFPSSSYASRYDMVYQGGAFYLLDGLRWNLGQAVDVRRRRLEPTVDRDGPTWLTDEQSRNVRDRLVWHLPLDTMEAHDIRQDAPGYFDMLEHPSYDAFWHRFDISRRHDAFNVPALHLTGWYDSLLVGTLRNFEGLESRGGQRLIVGPWTHARPRLDSTKIGDVDFGPDAGLDSIALMESWFDRWLVNESPEAASEPPVELFVMGTNQWRDETTWPLERAIDTPFYLDEKSALGREVPGAAGIDRFDYDPRDPVLSPSYAGYSRAPMDTRSIQAREDVLVYTSPPLDDPLEVTGYIELVLWIASSAPDTDFTGRLLDVFPDGSVRALSDGILRARYRNGFERPELLRPGVETELRIELGATSNVFLPGHRIQLEVSSSNFPRYDRNPNTGHAFGTSAELAVAKQSVFRGGGRASRLILPVVPQPDPEARFSAEVSATRLSEFHEKLTERPHRAGTDGGRAVADYLVETLTEAGLEVEVHEYFPYLSSPRSVQIARLLPTPLSINTREPADPRDPTSSHPELEPGFVGYSASGTVTGDVVYVGYGLPADYEELDVDVRGKIALARYGRSHRAVKVHTAQEKGALGVILYSDPEDDGAGRGLTWPEGPWRGDEQIQRGNAKFSWFWHGDPLTPGEPATRDARRLSPKTAPTLPSIPVAPISAREAAKLRVPGATVRLSVTMNDGETAIRNVIAKIPGTEVPERWVMLGTHHDAWTFGGVDPGSAAASLLEVARALQASTDTGWRPRRSIVFAFWDAEEYGLVGSTEFAEDHIEELREKVAVYINTDMYNGTRLVAGGTPTLQDFVETLVADMPEIELVQEELNALGSGADFVPFQDYVGLPTLSLEFLFEGGWGFGTYHSNYDSRYWMTRHGDTDFEQGALLAQLLGKTAIRLATASVLPYRFSYYGGKMSEFVDLAESWGDGTHRFEALRVRAKEIERKSVELERLISETRTPLPPGLNDGLMRLEHALIDETEPADERWYRHVIYGWNIFALYSGQPFPGLAAAITRGSDADIAREAARIERALSRLAAEVDALISTF